MQPLDPLTIPLTGHRLLEASAGTGKTYTLVLLFLRLLLERELTVDRILVVTFTRAATSELRDRIRKRLREALDHFDQPDTSDPQLAALLAAVPAEAGRQRLGDALTQMDEAAIHTIHGFCQRILQDHAFESGQPFEVELLESEAALRLQVIEDFWRNRFYPAGEVEAAWATATWAEPAGLLKVLGSAMTALDCDLIPAVEAEAVQALAERCSDLFGEVRRAWPEIRDEVRGLLEEEPSCLQRNAKAYRLHDRVPELLAAMDELAAQPDLPWLLPKAIGKLAASEMAKLLKKCNQPPPSHSFFDLFDSLHCCLTRFLHDQTILVLHEARLYLRQELDKRKQRQGWCSFDDLLTRLDSALQSPASGPLLAARIAARYPAALVDEFQDTDPVQYRLFARIYVNGTLLMIGDPKQAIYSFRGADIFTYIRARRDTQPANRYTMAVNYRSTGAMVGAVNALFGQRPDAFVFTEDIAFHPVHAAAGAKARQLLLDGRAAAPLTGLILDSGQLRTGSASSISKERAGRAAVAFCADTIVGLLEKAAQGTVTLDGVPLAASDIAILVRTHREAEAMQNGLRIRGLNSVSSSQTSVFATAEARQLALVLAALIDLTDTPRLRTALATPLFGCTALDLQALAGDEHGWNNQLATLLHYQHLWRDQGFLPMLHQLMAGQQVTRRLSALPGGERSLTNFLHLAELLQQSPAGRHGMAALLRWFRQQLHSPDDQAADQLVRLENDEQLIRIVTIHRAKGLEFPVVFLPFPWAGRTLADGQPLSFHDRRNLRLTVDLGSGREEHRTWAGEEQLAEDLRLLYVAVTRAKSCCLFCWGRVKGLELTPLAHLLHAGRLPKDDAELLADLSRLNEKETVLAIQPWRGDFGRHRLAVETAQSPPRTLPFRGRINLGWSMTSYSRLSAGTERPSDNDHEQDDSPRSPEPEDFTSPFTFPRGPAAGTCLHALLERLDFNRPVREQQPLINEVLAQGGIDHRWQAATVRWLEELLAVELPGSCPLARIAPGDRINELSFLFPLEQVDLRRLNALLETAGLRPLAVAGSALQGLMKGFIDLVFRFQGRYYLADYKSNHLGAALPDYGPEGLTECMDSHQYHLQSLIYTLALHRFLSSRVPGYRYDTHFGGVYYLFLRAMHPAHPPGTGVHVSRPPASLITALDACCRGQETR